MARTTRTPRRTRTTTASNKSNTTDQTSNTLLWTIGAAVVTGGAYLARSSLKRVWDGLSSPRNAEHAAPDLALDAPRPGTGDRAPDAFRPDPTAAVPASEREGLRPATAPAPTMVAGQPTQLDRIGGGNA